MAGVAMWCAPVVIVAVADCLYLAVRTIVGPSDGSVGRGFGCKPCSGAIPAMLLHSLAMPKRLRQTMRVSLMMPSIGLSLNED